MRITLISPRIAVQKGDFFGSGVPYWPVEIAVLASFLRQKGEDVQVIDLFGENPFLFEERQDHYLQGAPISLFLDSESVRLAEMFIIYAMSCMSHSEILSIAHSIKATRKDVMVAALENSQAVTAYSLSSVATEFFQSGVDALICGEAYWNWDEIKAFLLAPQEAHRPENILVSGVPGNKPVRRKFEKRPSYPIPAWDMFKYDNYWRLPYSHGPKTDKFFPMFTSKGCPYPCDFCVVPETNERQWRGREPEEVAEEMISLSSRFGVRHFQIEDVNPTVKAGRWDRICEILIQRNANVSFYFVSGTKAETISPEQTPLYAKAGCRYISISPESGSPRLLSSMGKSFDHEHGLKLIHACRRNGITTQACFLTGHPDETEEDHNQSREYLRSLIKAGLDEVAVFGVVPLSGSVLFKSGGIGLKSNGALLSFSPRGREDWDTLARRRRDLISIFFRDKLINGADLWLEGIRALLGRQRTKMGNLPRRIAFVLWSILKLKARSLL